MKQSFLEAGKVRNTHALRGEVKFECWLDGKSPLSRISFLYLEKNEEKKLKVLAARPQGDVFLVLFEGIDSVEKASLLKGKTLYVSREEADPTGKNVYFADLIGLPLVEDESGEIYGKISEVTSRGASELFLISLPDGTEKYFPAVKEFIVRMSADEGVFVRAPKGIFD